MSSRFINNDDLFNWLTLAQTSNLTYFSVRRTLFQKFSSKIQLFNSNHEDDDFISLTTELYNHIWQFLTARNDHITDNSRLSFQASVDELLTLATPPENINNNNNRNNAPRSPIPD